MLAKRLILDHGSQGSLPAADVCLLKLSLPDEEYGCGFTDFT